MDRVYGQREKRTPAGEPGFTLIELLMVAAMLALLVAILLPSLARARMQARIVQVHCDLRQITVALDAYAMNNKNKFPATRFGCETNVNYQLPVELAKKRYFPKSPTKVPQAAFWDAFDPEHTYKYRAPGAIYYNMSKEPYDFPEPDDHYRFRAKIWVPDDFPHCRSKQGRYYYNRTNEPKSPATYAVWSMGPDPESPKFPRDEDDPEVIEESRFPLPREFWLTHSGDTGLITHFRSDRPDVIHMSP